MLASVRGFAVEAIQFKNHGNTEFFVGENKVITPKQQFLGIISCFFYEFKMAVDILLLCKNAVEAIWISLLSVHLPLCYMDPSNEV